MYRPSTTLVAERSHEQPIEHSRIPKSKLMSRKFLQKLQDMVSRNSLKGPFAKEYVSLALWPFFSCELEVKRVNSLPNSTTCDRVLRSARALSVD
jgi:hypothetical protein